MPRHDVPRRRPCRTNGGIDRERAAADRRGERSKSRLLFVVAMRRAYHDWSLRYLVKVDTEFASNSVAMRPGSTRTTEIRTARAPSHGVGHRLHRVFRRVVGAVKGNVIRPPMLDTR